MALLQRASYERVGVPVYLVGSLALTAVTVAALILATHPYMRWGMLALLPIAGWLAYRWHQSRTQARTNRAIASRLDRLPEDFLVLHNLTVPAPWGHSTVDHLIVSRFGIVVAANGPTPCWMLERVEAVRSLLISRGLANGSLPIRPLVLLPPGSSESGWLELDAPAVRVEQIRLQHLAPGPEQSVPAERLHSISQYLLSLQHAG